MKNVSLAFYHACKRYPGTEALGCRGITAVAKLLGMDPDVLQKKLSPTCDSHHLMVDEAEAITELIHDQAGAIELARVAGLATIPLPHTETHGSLLKGVAEIGQEFTDLVNFLNESMSDNRVTPGECDRVQGKALELFAACIRELARMRALADSRGPIIPLREVGK